MTGLTTKENKMLTRNVRKALYQCEGRQIVLTKDFNFIIVWDLGQHDWTRTPNPSKVNGDQISRFDCGATITQDRNKDNTDLPIATFRQHAQPQGKWKVFIPEHFNPYDTLVQQAKRANLIKDIPSDSILIPTGD